MNTAIILSYDGTAYHGWQTQRNASSVQQTVTEALASLLGQDVSVSGVGRTDAGVHARRYVANFHGTHTIPMGSSAVRHQRPSSDGHCGIRCSARSGRF